MTQCPVIRLIGTYVAGLTQAATSLRLGYPTTRLNCWIPYRQYSFFEVRLGLRVHLAAMVKELKNVKVRVFDAQAFLDSAGVARKVKEFKKAELVYSQGDAAESVMYLQEGSVKLAVVSEEGKEAVVAILGPGDFFGEGCLAGQSVRMGTATAITPSTVLVVEKSEMFKVLHEQHALSDRFISFMLARNIRIEEDLIDQLFNSSEKRLARTLLLLARYGKEDGPQGVIPKVSQETLAEMIGTTRSRVNFFMNKFRKLGFIKYNGGLQINTSLLSVVLHE
jgi:CRP/FNR family transcriptional regulator, cyclic AMP receptor protein